MHAHAEDTQVSLLIAQEEAVESLLVGEGSDGVGGELEGSVVFGLFEEYYLHVSIVETSDHHNFVIDDSHGHVR